MLQRSPDLNSAYVAFGLTDMSPLEISQLDCGNHHCPYPYHWRELTIKQGEDKCITTY